MQEHQPWQTGIAGGFIPKSSSIATAPAPAVPRMYVLSPARTATTFARAAFWVTICCFTCALVAARALVASMSAWNTAFNVMAV